MSTSCGVCFEYMFEPRVFECGHTLCLGCQLGCKFKCPICRKVSKRIAPNIILRNLLQELEPEKYLNSKQLYEENQLERAYTEVFKKEPTDYIKQFGLEDVKILALIIFRYDYWVLTKGKQEKFESMLKEYPNKRLIVTKRLVDDFAEPGIVCVSYKKHDYLFVP